MRHPVAVDVTNSPTEAETLAGAMLNTDIDDPNAIDMQAPHVDATHKRPDSEPDTNARKRRGI